MECILRQSPLNRPQLFLCLRDNPRQQSWRPGRHKVNSHFSAKDLEDKILKLHGIKTSEEKENVFKLKVCPKCGTKNEPDKVRCNFCGLILDQKLAINIFEEEKKREEEILRRVERLEQLISQLLNQKS